MMNEKPTYDEVYVARSRKEALRVMTLLCNLNIPYQATCNNIAYNRAKKD